MGIQLYPPIIPVTLDAMYSIVAGSDISIKIPFKLNKAVSNNQIYGFNILIKTPFTNKVLINQNIESNIETMILNNMVEATIPSTALVPGEYYKVQLSFLNKDLNDITPTVGYASSVATVKYTILPTVTIKNAFLNEEPIFRYTYYGSFNNEAEPSETRESYIFEIYTDEEEPHLVVSSGWLFLNPNNNYDEYTFLSEAIENHTMYLLRYGVKTINNLIVYSNYYSICKAEDAPSDLDGFYNFTATNNFDNGYINLHLELIDNNDTKAINGMFIIMRSLNENGPFMELTRKNIVLPQTGSQPANYTWNFKDFIIEQGEVYYYAIQQYNSRNIYSKKIITSPILADFEDSFLWDGEKQLKIKFNPKISSFKIDRQEQKMETSGSQFPFFTRNGKIAYHEFPISGLCSYLMDEEQLFMKDNELGLINDPTTISDIRQQTAHSSDEDSAQRCGRTTNLINYNFLAERRFKNKVLEWLGNGKPKFYKSPSEGNFIVRLMNVSLSPEDKTSRMIHNFSTTAYEIMEINSTNLLEYNFQNNDINHFEPVEGQLFNNIKEIIFTEFLFPINQYPGYINSDNGQETIINRLTRDFDDCLFYEIYQKDRINEGSEEFDHFVVNGEVTKSSSTYTIKGVVATNGEGETITLSSKYLYNLKEKFDEEDPSILVYPAGQYRYNGGNNGQFISVADIPNNYKMKINDNIYYVYDTVKSIFTPKIKPNAYEQGMPAASQAIYITTGILFIPKKRSNKSTIIYTDGTQKDI